MTMFRYVKFQPNTADNIIAGAKMVIPADKPRCIKNKMAVKLRVFKIESVF